LSIEYVDRCPNVHWYMRKEVSYEGVTEFRERVVESIIKDVLHLCRIGGVSDVWEDLVGVFHVEDGWCIISLCTPVALPGTAVCGFAFWCRLFSSNNIVSIGSHEYSVNCLLPYGVVVLGQLRDVAVNALEGFGRHCAGGWCIRGFGGLCKSGRTEVSGVLVIMREW